MLYEGEVRFGIEPLSTGELIGNVGLHHFFEQNRRCEIGYALASRHWGEGYATEALRAAIRHGFDALNLNRIEADIDPRNIGSARVLEKAGRIRLAAPSRPGSTGGRRGPRSPGHT
ncbi:GNAT family N-acetyltransferase [Archangium lipolyticum]|uniref:GNAT family N-acetyltransferase n=1 Tax=Archangium lipolyticum TaxID=2970465 RepID=UPI002DD61E2A|nr:GNAT family N-acetyltransferase [Archangium lipolyticum]